MRPSGDIFSSCTQKSVIKRSFEPGTDGSAPPMVGAREVVLLVVAAVVATEGALLQLQHHCYSTKNVFLSGKYFITFTLELVLETSHAGHLVNATSW